MFVNIVCHLIKFLTSYVDVQKNHQRFDRKGFLFMCYDSAYQFQFLWEEEGLKGVLSKLTTFSILCYVIVHHDCRRFSTKHRIHVWWSLMTGKQT